MAEICCNLVETKGKESPSCGESNPRVARRRRIEFRRMRFVPVLESQRKRPRQNGLLMKKDRDSHGSASREGTESGSGLSSDFESDSSVGKRWSEKKDQCLSFGVTSVCGRRREMEDSVSIHMDFVKNYKFFGVFDGHGCSHVSTLCKKRMHDIIASEMEQKVRSNETLDDSQWREAMKLGFAKMDKEAVHASGNNTNGDGIKPPRVHDCSCEMRTPRCDHVGSTAVVAVVGPANITVANCGDSRAVLCRNGSAIPLSSDHKPDRPDELQRIQEAGGKVIYWDGARVFGVLAMSRAIGDSYLKPYVISEPEVTITERNDGDECLILASDGLWDVISNETACEIVRRCLRSRGNNNNGDEMEQACSDAAMLLTKLALARHSSDNVSVIVINLKTGVL